MILAELARQSQAQENHLHRRAENRHDRHRPRSLGVNPGKRKYSLNVLEIPSTTVAMSSPNFSGKGGNLNPGVLYELAEKIKTIEDGFSREVNSHLKTVGFHQISSE